MSANSGPGYIQYTIQPGDSLWDIADQYNLSAQEIMAANPNIDFNNLVVGQAISIASQPQRTRPTQPTTPPAARPSEPGRGPEERRPEERRPDGGRSDGRRPDGRRPDFGRPDFRRPDYRRPDYYRRRPYYRPYPYPYQPYYPPYEPAQVCPYGATPYTVLPGDSLYSIADRFGISVDTIIAANPYVNFGAPLQTGQNICLPA